MIPHTKPIVKNNAGLKTFIPRTSPIANILPYELSVLQGKSAARSMCPIAACCSSPISRVAQPPSADRFRKWVGPFSPGRGRLGHTSLPLLPRIAVRDATEPLHAAGGTFRLSSLPTHENLCFARLFGAKTLCQLPCCPVTMAFATSAIASK